MSDSRLKRDLIDELTENIFEREFTKFKLVWDELVKENIIDINARRDMDRFMNITIFKALTYHVFINDFPNTLLPDDELKATIFDFVNFELYGYSWDTLSSTHTRSILFRYHHKYARLPGLTFAQSREG